MLTFSTDNAEEANLTHDTALHGILRAKTSVDGTLLLESVTSRQCSASCAHL